MIFKPRYNLVLVANPNMIFVTSIGEHRSTEFAGGTLDGAVFAFPAPRAGIPEPRFGG